MTVPRFDVAERRARLARRHALVEPLDDVASVTEAMVVLHATDPATVFLSALARLADPEVEQVTTALYVDRTVARVLAMRRTLFVARVGDLDMVERSSTDAVARTERKRLEGFLVDSGVADPGRWLADARDEVIEVLDEADDGLPARSITARVPRLTTKLVMGSGTRNEVTAGATSRVLAVLANEGVLMRGRPAGNWTGRQYTWHLRHRWLPGDRDGGGRDAVTAAEASAALVEAWLRRFGPATITDLRWWTGWTAAAVTTALAALDVVEVDLDGRPGLVLGDDVEPEPDPGPWTGLLPSLDPTPMGWKERDWYLGPHQGPLFDRNGNIGPTVWVDGRIVGGWAQRPDGEVVVRLLEDVGADHRAMIDADVERLHGALGPTVVKPSFPTPLQKELAAGEN